MASSGISIIVLVLVSMSCGGVFAQSPSSCTNTITSLAPCLNYITGSSVTPSSSCCSQLASVVQTSPQCLCQVINANGASLGFTVNRTLALSLPGACKVQTPPISQCKAAAAPSVPLVTSPISSPPEISPASSPAEATAAAPTEASNGTPDPTTNNSPAASQVPSSAETGSKTVPSTTTTSSGNIVKAPLHFVLFVFFVVACVSTVTNF